MIKVQVNSTEEAIEIVKSFKDTTSDLTIEIKNTTAENSDARKGSRTQVVSHGRLVELD